MQLATFLRVNPSDNKPSIHRRASRAVRCVAFGVGALLAIAHSAAAPAGAGEVPMPPVRTQSVQSLSEVARAAEAAVHRALPASASPHRQHRISARAPDPRLRLSACPAALQTALPVASNGIQARTLVQVRCISPAVKWSVFVPVSLETDAEVLVAARPLRQGTTPGPDDVRSMKRTLHGISDSYVTHLDQIRAHGLRRAVAAGQPLTRDLLAPEPVVRRGEAVSLVAQLAGLEVRMPGRALADARPGDLVRVQNVNSLKIIEGRADAAGVVKVDR